MQTRDILNNTGSVFKDQPTGSSMNKHSDIPDHEVQMARADLYKLAKYAIKLHELIKIIPEDQGLEGWVQSKITKASDYISSVYHYLEYEMKMGESVNEAPVPPAVATPVRPAVATPVRPAVATAATGAANPQATAALVAAEITAKKKEIQDQIKAKQTEIAGLQKQLGAVGTGRLVQSAYESASACATSAGGIATGAGNGFKNGGPGTVARAKKVKENDSDNEETYRVQVQLDNGIKFVRVSANDDATAEQKAMNFCRRKNLNPVSAKSLGIYYAESTGPKFTGYWKGTDKGSPGKKMVGGE